MADTRRTLTALQALLPDNAAGGIDAQDLRDFLLSASPARGSMYVSTAGATTIAGSSTWTKVAGTTTSIFLTEFTMPADNRLLYTGTPDLFCHVTVALSTSAAAANKNFEFGVYRYDNSGAAGAMIGHSTIARYHSSGDTGAIGVQAWVTMSTSDYIEIHTQNTADTTNITADYMTVGIQGLIS